MGLSGFVGSGVQDALSQQLMEQLRVAALAEEQRQALEREAMASREQARREAEDADQRTQADFLRKRLINQDAQAANVLRDAQIEKQTLANQRNDAALVQQMPGMSPEQKNAELAGIGTRAGEVGFIDLMKLNAPPQPAKKFTAPIKLSNGTIQQFEEGQIPPGTRFYEEPRATPTGDFEWVNRNGQAVQIRKGTAQPGDTPYVKTDTGMTDGDRQRQARAEAASTFLSRLNDLRKTINTKMGPEQGLTGLMRRGSASVGLDPDVSQYERERAAAGRALAVAIMGAQNLSDADAAAWARMLPDATTDEQTAQRLINSVQTTLDQMTGKAHGTEADPVKPGGPQFRYNPQTKKLEPVR